MASLLSRKKWFGFDKECSGLLFACSERSLGGTLGGGFIHPFLNSFYGPWDLCFATGLVCQSESIPQPET